MKKFLIWAFSVIFFAVLVLRGLPYIVTLYLNANADTIVSNMITRTSIFGEHQVSFGDIKLDYNFFGTYLRIRDIQVDPSDELDESHVKVNLRIDDLDISGFKWRPFLFSNTLSIDTAKVNNVRIISSSPPIEVLMNKDKERGYKKEGRDYDLIGVKFFGLNNLSVELKNNVADSVRVQMENMGLTVKGFELTKEDIENPSALFQVQEVAGDIQRAVFHFDDFRQYVEVRDISLNSSKNSMAFGYLGLLNKIEKYGYTGQFDERQTFLEIQKAQMQLHGFDFKSYLKTGIIEVDTVFSNKLHLEVFVDKRKTENTSKRPKMFHQMLGDLQKRLHVNHLFLDSSYLKIEERPDNASPISASLFFSDLSAHISNITNFEDRVSENPMLLIDAKAKLLGKGAMNVEIKTDLHDPSGKFWLKGTLRSMDLTALNSMIEPEARASLRSGKLDRLDFNIAGNDYEGTGELIIRYQDLELELLNREFLKDDNVFRKLVSFLANKVVIKSNNPDRRGNLKKGEVYFLREQHKSVFSYWWKLIFSGLRSTITGENKEDLKKKELAKRAG